MYQILGEYINLELPFLLYLFNIVIIMLICVCLGFFLYYMFTFKKIKKVKKISFSEYENKVNSMQNEYALFQEQRKFASFMIAEHKKLYDKFDDIKIKLKKTKWQDDFEQSQIVFADYFMYANNGLQVSGINPDSKELSKVDIILSTSNFQPTNVENNFALRKIKSYYEELYTYYEVVFENRLLPQQFNKFWKIIKSPVLLYFYFFIAIYILTNVIKLF